MIKSVLNSLTFPTQSRTISINNGNQNQEKLSPPILPAPLPMFPGVFEAVCEPRQENEPLSQRKLKNDQFVDAHIFIRNELKLLGSSEKISFRITNLTISNTKVHFSGIDFRCKISVTGRATLTATKCSFTSISPSNEAPLEIFGSSSGTLVNCEFLSSQSGLIVRDTSSAMLSNCKFSQLKKTGILVLQQSSINITQCDFSEIDKYGIYVYKSSYATIARSTFHNQTGRGIFMMHSSHAYVDSCNFNRIQTGAIACLHGSIVLAKQCDFSDISSTSIHAVHRSQIKADSCKFTNCAGNGVNIDTSTGFVYNCVFSQISYPALAVYGYGAVPVFYGCTITNCASFAITSRDCAMPIFDKITIDDVKSHAFSISDFSSPLIRNCTLRGVGGSAFLICNGSSPIIEDTIVESAENGIDIFAYAAPKFTRNVFYDNAKVKIHHGGELFFNGDVEKLQIEGTFSTYTESPIEYGDEHSLQKISVSYGTGPSPPKALMNYVSPPEISKPLKAPEQDEFLASCCRSEDCAVPPPQCFECKQRPATSFISPCGHRCLCATCAKAIKLRPRDQRKCPLCATPFIGTTESFVEPECVVCMDRPSDTIILPCGHQQICFECAMQIGSDSRQCPICSQRALSFRHVFPLT